jgi:hypothetical protein
MEKLVIKGRSYITGKIKEMILYEAGKDNHGETTFLSPSNYQAIYSIDKTGHGGKGRLVTAKPHTAQRTIMTHIEIQTVNREVIK